VFSSVSFAADQEADRALIEKTIASYTKAFNSGDAKSLASHWGKDAVYTNPFTGLQVVGREEIAAEFDAILKEHKETKLVVEVESIQFVSPNVAVESGIAKIISADGEQLSSYSAVHVKTDGKWHLDRVTEEEIPVTISNYEKLKGLEWLIGSWIDGDDQASIETTCSWTKNKNFMTRSFTVRVGDQVDMSGMQIIGWDASKKQIRSWVFDSDGGFAEGIWTQKGEMWYVTASGTLPDGSKATSINVFKKVDDDRFKWQSVNRTVAGKLLPNIDEVLVIRD
jgi:uncharacterized protein (TIGR02246 family)